MNLYISTHCRRYYAVEAVVTSEGIEYKTYPAYLISELKKYWASLANSGIPGTLIFDDQHPMITPDMKPLWTTDTVAVYDVQVANNTYTSGVIDFQLDIKNNNDYSDHAQYDIYSPGCLAVTTVFDEHRDKHSNDIMSYSAMTKAQTVSNGISRGYMIPIHNSVAQTSHSRMKPHVHQRLTGNAPMISIMVPLADMDPTDWEIVFTVAEEGLLRVNGNTVEPIPVGYLLNHMPKVWFKKNTATVNTNNFVDLEFYLGTASGSPITGHDATVYIKTTGGQLNKTQVRTVNGEGKVKLISNHLESGDVIKVSVGFQYYSGTDDCIVTVK